MPTANGAIAIPLLDQLYDPSEYGPWNLGWDNPNCEMQPVAIEHVHSMPGQGVASSFKFGQGFGHLEMALTAARIPFTYVTPQKWQKELGCLTGGDKNVSKSRAQQLFPHIKVTHAIADSLLITEYCRRTIK